MVFEEQIQKSMFTGNKEKTFVDKVLAKDDIDSIRSLMKKPKLTREDLLELLYLLGSSESKLFNLGEWDRYVMLKFFVWIREFCKVLEQIYDYEEDMKKWQEEGKKNVFDEETKQLFNNNIRYMEHNIKFLVDLYLNMGRTTLSLNATGFIELLKNRFEVAYNNNYSQNLGAVEKKGFGGLFK
jgi:hypothetical protein